MTTIKSLIGQFAAAALIFPLGAETVAWYHFSEMVPGEASTASTVFENAANPGVMQAYPATTVSDRRTDLVGVAAWPEKMLLCDGTNGIDVVNVGGRGFYSGSDIGIVKVADDLEAIADTENDVSVEKSFTMEFFVRCVSLPSTDRVLLSRKALNGSFWRLVMKSTGQFKFVSSSDDTNYNWDYTIGGDNLGKWHHVAVSYDATARNYAVYFDYVKIRSQTVASKLPLGDAPIILGGFTGSYLDNIGNKKEDDVLTVNFHMDEFRISGKVLAPSEFMGWKLASESGVAVKLGFDDLSTAGLDMFPLALGWNSAAHPVVNQAVINVNSGASATATTADESVAVVHDGIRDEGCENFGALALVGNESHQSARISVPAAGLTDTGFTVETFVKFDPDNFWFPDNNAGYLFEASGSWNVRFWSSSGAISCTVGDTILWVNKGYWGNPPEGKNVDGDWHHIAFVYDAAALTSTFYVDYKSRGSKSGALSLAADGKLYIAGGHWNTTTGIFGDALLDEVKVTRLALKPWEFQRGDNIVGPTLLWADFDDGSGLDFEPVISPFTSSTFNGTPHPAQNATVPAQTTETVGKDVLNTANTASMRFNNAGYLYFATPAVLAPEVTVEMFIKNQSTGAAGMIALYDGNSVNDAIWGLELDTDGATPVFVVGAGVSQTRVAFTGAALDARWHHLAFVMTTPDDGNSTVKFFLDGELVSTQNLSVRIRQTSTTPRVWLGRTTNNVAFSGYMDEVRISEGELSAGDMMLMKRNGLSIVFR